MAVVIHYQFLWASFLLRFNAQMDGRSPLKKFLRRLFEGCLFTFSDTLLAAEYKYSYVSSAFLADLDSEGIRISRCLE
jgi:hypothetical protein